MKCQKCGAELISGHLYCDICGAEFQIVPNFEPEIENSIAKNLSVISETIEKDVVQKVNKTHKNISKVPSFSIILTIVFLCSIFICCIGS